MTEKIFKFPNVDREFHWIKGVKTINVTLPNSTEHIDSMSFDHHLSETTTKRAKQVIKQYIRNNGLDGKGERK